jgi:competence protein ComER
LILLPIWPKIHDSIPLRLANLISSFKKRHVGQPLFHIMEEGNVSEEGHRMKIGFIGAGSMGSLLMDAFVRTEAIRPENLMVSSRTTSKAAAIAQRHPGIRIGDTNIETANGAAVLFLCIKPMDYRSVLDEIGSTLMPDQIVVSITSSVKISQLEAGMSCKVAKIIPSVVNAAASGASLFMWGSRLSNDDRLTLWNLFSRISRPVEIAEEEVRVASDLSSCGPAFFAYLLDQFIEAAVLETGMDRSIATSLASEMMYGTAKLLADQGLSLEAVDLRRFRKGSTDDAREIRGRPR